MDHNNLVAALMLRVPGKVSWSWGFGDEEANGKGWRGFLDRLLNELDCASTVPVTLLLELPAELQEDNYPRFGHQNQ